MSFFAQVYPNLPPPAAGAAEEPSAEAVAALAALSAGVLPLRERGMLSGEAPRLYDTVSLGQRGGVFLGERRATRRQKRMCAAAGVGDYVPGDRTNACRLVVCTEDKRYAGCYIAVTRATGQRGRVKREVQHLYPAHEFQRMYEQGQAPELFEDVPA